jgi:DNA-binding transcriptional ArsR family regulator
MGCRVAIDAAPAYELYPSLLAFIGRDKSLDRGPAWSRAVKKALDPLLVAELEQLGKGFSFRDPMRKKFPDNPLFWWVWLLPPLIRDCPEERTVSGFLGWLEELPPAALYERMTRWLPPGLPLSDEIRTARRRILPLLKEWNHQYLGRMDPSEWDVLRRDAEQKRRRIGSVDPEELIEEATNGLCLSAAGRDITVLLVPQIHFVPANLLECYRGLYVIHYPCEMPSDEGEPPSPLLRIIRSLADGNRLRILRFLSEGPRSFMEIVRHTGLAKSTVHHHMVSLRSAGLVRTMLDLDTNEQHFGLREHGLGRFQGLLAEFLSGEDRPYGPP